MSWTLTLKSGTTHVRSLTGTSTTGKVAPVWNGTTPTGSAAAEGNYTWTLTARDTVTGRAAADITGKVTLRRTVPAATVTSPTVASSAATTASGGVVEGDEDQAPAGESSGADGGHGRFVGGGVHVDRFEHTDLVAPAPMGALRRNRRRR